jgi:hypothetical protein
MRGLSRQRVRFWRSVASHNVNQGLRWPLENTVAAHGSLLQALVEDACRPRHRM